LKKVASLLLSGLLASVAWAGHGPKLSKDLEDVTNNNPESSVRVIVQWKSAPGSAKDQKILSRGGRVHSTFRSVKAGSYTLPAWAVRDLENDPDVAYITPDRPISAKLDNTAAAVNASAAWSAGFSGTGIGVVVIDSGMNGDSNLPKFAYTYDFTNSKAAGTMATLLANAPAPLPAYAALPGAVSAPDQYGHGQHVAGVIASNGHDSSCDNCKKTFKGLASTVSLVNFRVLDLNGQGTDSNVILAIETAIYLKNVLRIRVINLSLGRPVFESYTQDPLCQAVEAAWKAGIVVVVAAGNDGRDNTFGEQG
jgi:serine protease AprX